jgi:hypothetical protein
MWFFVALFAAYLVHFLTVRLKPLRWAAIAISMLVLAFDMDFHGMAYGTLWLLAGAQVERLF